MRYQQLVKRYQQFGKALSAIQQNAISNSAKRHQQFGKALSAIQQNAINNSPGTPL
ncbi:MAG: hypothetical protein K6A32_09470 [Bacteroidales bacterium]|nr:hypothetical protein [Bacteroidales bacterium]